MNTPPVARRRDSKAFGRQEFAVARGVVSSWGVFPRSAIRGARDTVQFAHRRRNSLKTGCLAPSRRRRAPRLPGHPDIQLKALSREMRPTRARR